MDAKTEKKVKVLTQKVKDYLKFLGAGPNKVAEALKKAKIKGEPGSSSHCPLANALKKKFKALTEIQVSNEIGLHAYGEDITIKTPVACCKFIDKFDEEQYPALLEDAWIEESSS